ncbi:unnamed protein product [Arabidopsis halleri]
MDKTVMISTGSVLYPNVQHTNCLLIEGANATNEAAIMLWYQAAYDNPSSK